MGIRRKSANWFSRCSFSGHGQADAGARPENVLGGAFECRRRVRGFAEDLFSRGQRPHDGDRRADRKAYEALAHGANGDGGPDVLREAVAEFWVIPRRRTRSWITSAPKSRRKFSSPESVQLSTECSIAWEKKVGP